MDFKEFPWPTFIPYGYGVCELCLDVVPVEELSHDSGIASIHKKDYVCDSEYSRYVGSLAGSDRLAFLYQNAFVFDSGPVTTNPQVIDLKPKTIDQMIDEIMAISQELVGPDHDPGDLGISIQDDMPMVTISQNNPNLFTKLTDNFPLPYGSVQEAVLGYLIRLINERELRKLETNTGD